MHILNALLLSTAIAGVAYRRRSLDLSGVAAAVPLGTLILTLGGWHYGVPLFVFFVTSSMLSKITHQSKRRTTEVFEKGSARDWAQVLANGGLGGAIVIAATTFPSTLWYPAYLGVMATVTADTWATEIGTMVNGKPRSIINWQPVPTGTSGGVSLTGTVGGACGAVLIAGMGNLYDVPVVPTVMIAIAGTCGMMTDSFLGATLQARFHCADCDREVESAQHCGSSTTHKIGLISLNNDMVNLISALAGGALSAAMMTLL